MFSTDPADHNSEMTTNCTAPSFENESHIVCIISGDKIDPENQYIELDVYESILYPLNSDSDGLSSVVVCRHIGQRFR